MKKAATNASRYVLSESSMVVIDHLQFQGSFFNSLFGRVRSRISLNNIGATFLDFNQNTFPEQMKDQYNLVVKLMDERNHKELIPYLSQPLYNVQQPLQRPSRR